MTATRALTIVFALGLFGTSFSGVLSYRELVGASALGCPAPGTPGTVFGYPACVYGFFMYLAITAVSALGLRASLRGRRAADEPSATMAAAGG